MKKKPCDFVRKSSKLAKNTFDSSGWNNKEYSANRSVFLNDSHVLIECFADIDQAYSHNEPNSPRWDYLLIIAMRRAYKIRFVEVHPKKRSKKYSLDEYVGHVICKAKWLKKKKADFPPELESLDPDLWKVFMWLGKGYPQISQHSKYARKLLLENVIYRPKIDLNTLF